MLKLFFQSIAFPFPELICIASCRFIPTRGYCATSGWACARPFTPSGDLRSQVAMYLYYNSSSNTKCTGCACAHDHCRHFRWKGPTRGIAKLPVAHAHIIFLVPGRASSGHVTSCDISSGHVTSGCSPLFPHKYDFFRTHILLMYLHLNNWEFCRVKSENMTLFLCVALDKKMYINI
jgi:hypothetical protein